MIALLLMLLLVACLSSVAWNSTVQGKAIIIQHGDLQYTSYALLVQGTTFPSEQVHFRVPQQSWLLPEKEMA